MHEKLQVCSAVGTGQQRGPNFSLLKSPKSQGETNKAKRSGIQVMPPLPSLRDLLPTSYHLLKYFDINLSARKKCFLNQQKVECSPRIHIIPKHIFYALGISKHF